MHNNKRKLLGFSGYYYGNESAITTYNPVVDIDGKDTLISWNEDTKSASFYQLREKGDYLHLKKPDVEISLDEEIIAAGINVVKDLRQVPSMIKWYSLFKSWEPYISAVNRPDSNFLNAATTAEKGFYWTVGDSKVYKDYADAYISDIQETVVRIIREKPTIPPPYKYENLLKPFHSKKPEHRLYRIALFPKSRMADFYAKDAVDAGDAESVYDFKDQVLDLQKKLEIPVGVYGDLTRFLQ